MRVSLTMKREGSLAGCNQCDPPTGNSYICKTAEAPKQRNVESRAAYTVQNSYTGVTGYCKGVGGARFSTPRKHMLRREPRCAASNERYIPTLTNSFPVGFSPWYVRQLFVANTNIASRCLGSVGKVPGAQAGTRACVARSTCRQASTSRSPSAARIMICDTSGQESHTLGEKRAG